MTVNRFDSRQTKLVTATGMIGSAANDTLDSVFPKINDELAKLYEDRNVNLIDGGIITFLGTSVQFTQALKLHLNSRVAGGSPQIIDLTATTRSIASSGDMIYAVVNRTAGTATVTAASATLPAVTSANQEVFLIAKRMDSADGIKRLYFRDGTVYNEGQSFRLGSGGSTGTGSGTGDDLNALTFKASFTELFSELTSDTNASVDYSANKTDPTLYSILNQYIRVSYDAAKTVAAGTTTTNLNISASASFTVKIGDLAIYNNEVRRITAVASQASFTVDAFSVAPTLAGQVTISQAVYSKDINNYAGTGIAPSTAFSTNINQILVTYEDTTTSGDVIFDANTTPVIAYSASSDGTNFTSKTVRPTNLSDTLTLTNLPTSSTNLYLRFFANATSGTGSVNILKYKTFFHRDITYQDGLLQNQAYGLTNGAGTEINIASISSVSGKTRIQMSWTYPVAVNAGTTNGSLEVFLNGQKVPRFVDSTITPDASYLEINQNTIELDQDYSSLSLSIEVSQNLAVIDNSETNGTFINQIQESIGEATQSFVKNSSLLTATSTIGTPVAGTFHSTISGRASIVDLTADLGVRFGINRITTQALMQTNEEVGPNGEPVFKLVTDPLNQVRFVGASWGTFTSANNGAYVDAGNLSGSFVEIVFYGTGLNLLGNFSAGATKPALACFVDGSQVSADIWPDANTASVISARNLSVNQVVPAAKNLALGLHTIRIQMTNTPSGISWSVYGLEVLNESSILVVNPGTAYVNGKKLVLNSQQSPAYNSGFDSGTLDATRGGRVISYLKSDGTFGKALQPGDASASALSFAGTGYSGGTANHQNEEILRIYYPREFGASRNATNAGQAADDFSSLTTTNDNRAFLLDDGTTNLHAVLSSISAGSQGSPETLTLGGTSAQVNFTFVGTGLDIVQKDAASGTLDVYNVVIDGAAVGNLSTTASTTQRTTRIVSGLPYGTHTIRFLRTGNVNQALGITKFIVYQPKKPSIPSGAIELADYNLLASYSFLTSAGITDTSRGILRKLNTREMIYKGAWVPSAPTTDVGGINVTAPATATADWVQYTFFGTGFDWRFTNGAATNTWQMTITDAANPSAAAPQNLSAYTTNSSFVGACVSSWTASTGTLVTNATSVGGAISITGLALGWHTVRIARSSGSAQFFHQAFDIITPAHSARSNIYNDYQNTLSVGSQGIADTRKLSAIKELTYFKKNSVTVSGVVNTPTSSVTSFVPVPDLTATIRTNGGDLEMYYGISSSIPAGVTVNFLLFVNGENVGRQKSDQRATSTQESTISDMFRVSLPAGVHKVDVMWAVSGGTVSLLSTRRTLVVEEVI